MRSKLRRLALDGRTYVYGSNHAREPREEIFVAYREGFKASPVRVRFAESEHRPMHAASNGVAWSQNGAVNFNTPAVARNLIELALARGWTPETSRQPFVVADGFEMLGLAGRN